MSASDKQELRYSNGEGEQWPLATVDVTTLCNNTTELDLRLMLAHLETAIGKVRFALKELTADD